MSKRYIFFLYILEFQNKSIYKIDYPFLKNEDLFILCTYTNIEIRYLTFDDVLRNLGIVSNIQSYYI